MHTLDISEIYEEEGFPREYETGSTLYTIYSFVEPSETDDGYVIYEIKTKYKYD